MLRMSKRRAGVAFALGAGATALMMFAASPASASLIFCGGGRGPTPEAAVDAALWDAKTSAESMGFYGPCTIIGEPVVGKGSNPWAEFYRASLNATCEQ